MFICKRRINTTAIHALAKRLVIDCFDTQDTYP
jgi:hypothetical protein